MKFLKHLLLAAVIAATSFSARAQFRGPGPGVQDLLNGTPLIVTTGGISNITVYGRATANGFALSPYFNLTNSGTPAIAFYQNAVIPNGGTGTTIGNPVLVGTVAGSGTTAQRGNLLVLTNNNCVGVQISVSNTHSASIVVSNLYFISQ
jgi:hypothetical protein